MESQDKKRVSLFRALEAKGWFWENDCLYPPNKTFWIRGDDPTWGRVLPKLYESMKSSLERMPEIEHLYHDKKKFQVWVEDTESLVTTLKELVEGEKAS
jgi:hypothetical protein